MAYIATIDDKDAEGDLAAMYAEMKQKRGRVSNVLAIQSLHPPAMQDHLELYMTLMFGKGGLSRLQRELIAVVVSAANGCAYCVAHHQDALAKYAKDDAWVAAIANDWREATLAPEQEALCVYAEGLTLSPASGRKDAVAALRAAGFDDAQILLATEITAYFNFVNRMVHGLGVDLETDHQSDFTY